MRKNVIQEKTSVLVPVQIAQISILQKIFKQKIIYNCIYFKLV